MRSALSIIGFLMAENRRVLVPVSASMGLPPWQQGSYGRRPWPPAAAHRPLPYDQEFAFPGGTLVFAPLACRLIRRLNAALMNVPNSST